MADYAASINTDDYIYMRPIYVTETSGQDRNDIFLRLELDASDFNFYYAREDGKDFRLCDKSNGSGCLNMFIARWDYTNKRAYLFFKLPFLGANKRKKLYAFWGNRFDAGISNLDNLSECFLLADDFNFFDGYKWSANSVSGTAFTVSNSSINIAAGYYIFPGGPGNFTDIVTGGTATASSQYSTAYVPSYASDNNLGSRWSSTSSAYPHWWKYDFGAGNTKIVKAFTIKQYIDTANGGKNFTFEGSNDNSNWDVLYTGVSPNDGNVIAFSCSSNTTAYRYYRVYWTSAWQGTTVSVYEFEFSDIALIEDNPLSDILRNKVSWVIEEGLVSVATPTTSTSYSHAWRFHDGTPITTPLNPEGYNGFDMRLYTNGSVNRSTNLVNSSTFVTYTGTGINGLQSNSFNYNTIAYWENTDYVYQGMKFRYSLPDYYDGWERSVLGNTELVSLNIWGEENTSAAGFALDWVIIRDYDLHLEPLYDTSELYVELAYVAPQPLDFIEYGPDVTSTSYFHDTTFSGADPYTMSDNFVDSISNVLIGSSLAGTVTIDFGRYGSDLTSDQYNHFDNNHVEFFNASKLSNNDLNPYGRNYWLCTTSSGVWAAIDFVEEKVIYSISVTAVSTRLIGMIKDYNVYGSNSDPRYFSSARVKLASGTLLQVTVEQPIYFSNVGSYRYYIIEAVNSYGGNVALQEWQMFGGSSDSTRKTIGQLRLYPVVFDSNEYYFPKYIKLLGSNDGYNWEMLTEPNLTYIPDEIIGTTDLALGKPATAQSYDPNPNNYTPGQAVDGNDTTFWFSNSGSYPQWWSVDLQGLYNIRRVKLFGRGSTDTQSCELYVSSDNVNWQLFHSTGIIPLNTLVDIYPVLYGRYIKVIVTYGSRGDGYCQLATLNVYAATNTLPDDAYVSYHKTYTPFYDYTYGRWQRISINNDKSYSLYKLECALNWGGAESKTKIAEWEMVERANLEFRTYRIMTGISSIFTNVWPAEESTFDDPIFYTTNDRFNMVGHFGLMKSSTISGSIDMVVRY